MEVDNTHFPQTKFLSFKQPPKFEAMTSKLKEFNAQVPEGDRLDDAELDKMHMLCMEGECLLTKLPLFENYVKHH